MVLSLSLSVARYDCVPAAVGVPTTMHNHFVLNRLGLCRTDKYFHIHCAVDCHCTPTLLKIVLRYCIVYLLGDECRNEASNHMH